MFDYEERYPPRDLKVGAAVTRLGPSPTGFVHLGNLFMAIVNTRLAEQSGGTCFLRIEDTDRKREVEGAVPALIESLAYFGIGFDEGVRLAAGGMHVERGDYGPYFQSDREEIYREYAEKLVAEGKAYYCFLTEFEIEAIRAEQESKKELPGIHGEYAEWRGADRVLVDARILAGEPYVIRLNAEAVGALASSAATENQDSDDHILVSDGIRGDIKMPRNIMDVVLIKRDGLPTYHFAHVVDDHLMRTTHVVRGEEWLPSLPIHIMLFEALGFEPPVYCHTALMMKADSKSGMKRKLSKRKDPEFALSYYIADGYHPLAVEEYLLTVINSNYEEWRLSNPELDNREFAITTEKMGVSGMLFDLNKLHDVSRDTLIRIPAEELSTFLLDWALRKQNEVSSEVIQETRQETKHEAKHDAKQDDFITNNKSMYPYPDLYFVLSKNKELLTAALDIGRTGEKPRKDLVYAAQMLEQVAYFFDEFFRMEDPLPENISEEEARELLGGYLASYDHEDDRETWFEKIRILAASHGYAPKPKDYKNSPDMYKGHVGDVSAVIRRALTGRLNAPDIHEIQQVLGEDRTINRISR